MTPANIVPKNGVLNLGCTFPKLLNIRPSLDIAYKILGSGYIEPNILKALFNFIIAAIINRYITAVETFHMLKTYRIMFRQVPIQSSGYLLTRRTFQKRLPLLWSISEVSIQKLRTRDLVAYLRPRHK